MLQHIKLIFFVTTLSLFDVYLVFRNESDSLEFPLCITRDFYSQHLAAGYSSGSSLCLARDARKKTITFVGRD